MEIRHQKRWLVVAGILLVFTLVWVALATELHPDPAWFGYLERWLLGMGAGAYLAFFLLFVVLAMLPLPTTFWILLGGALFGPVAGALLSLLAATLAAVLAFWLGRTWLQPWIEPRLGPRGQRLCADVEAEGWRVVALTRLVPVFPFAPTNYALGLVRLSLPVFAATTLVALVPSLFAYAWLGHASRVLVNGAGDRVQLGLITVAVLALLLLLPRLVRRIWRGQMALRESGNCRPPLV